MILFSNDEMILEREFILNFFLFSKKGKFDFS